MPNQNIIIVTGNTQLDPVNGSLLLNFDELVNDLGIDYVATRVNNSVRTNRSTDTEGLYTTNLNLNDVVNLQVIAIPSTLGKQISLTRRDYTTDDQNGDNGIRDTFITSTSGTTGPLSLTFTATTTSDAYSFRYIVDATTFVPPPTPTVTLTPTPTVYTFYRAGEVTDADISTTYCNNFPGGQGYNISSPFYTTDSALIANTTVIYSDFNLSNEIVGSWSISNVTRMAYITEAEYLNASVTPTTTNPLGGISYDGGTYKYMRVNSDGLVVSTGSDACTSGGGGGPEEPNIE